MVTRAELDIEAANKKSLEDQRDNSIRKALNEEEAKRQANLKNEVSVLRKEERDAQFQEKWALVGKLAEEALGRGMEGYNEWMTAMMNIVNACKALSAALCVTFDNRPIESLLKGMWDSKLGIAPLVNLLDKKGLNLGEKIDDMLREKGLKKDDLFPLKVNVNFNGKGEMNVVVNYDGKPLPEEQQNTFAAGLVAWAKSRGYEQKNAVLQDNITKEPMTKEAFIKLNADDENSLQSFFSRRYKMTAELGNVSSSTPAP